MPEKDYPQKFLRGLSSKDFVYNGQVLPTAFQFDVVEREDGMCEASINWLDDVGAIDIALRQRKENGKKQFVAGVAQIDLELMKLVLQSMPPEVFSYERAELPENRYHGNLLLSSTVNKPMKQMVMSGLALAAGTNIIAQTQE